MGAILKVNRHDRVVTVGLHWYGVTWNQGRLLWGGPVFGTSNFGSFQLDLRYWEVVPGKDINFEGNPRRDKNVLLVIKDGERVVSHEAFGYEKFVKDKQDTYAVFKKNGNTDLVSCSEYDVYIQAVQDRTQNRNVTAIIAVRKAS